MSYEHIASHTPGEKNAQAAIATRLVVALDTSTDMLACAVAEVGSNVRVLAAADRPCRRRANVELVGAIQSVVAEAGYTMSDVDVVLVGRGPGSFTGVRIGIATAKGLAAGLEKPLVGVSVLDAMAWQAQACGVRGTVAVAGDAMRGEVYPGIYLVSETGVERCFAAETVVRAAVCVEQWAQRSDAAELVLCGNGLARYAATFAEAGLCTRAPEEAWYPTGEALIRAAHAAGLLTDAACAAGDPALVLPIYTRLSDAEEAERTRLGLKGAAPLVEGVNSELAGRHLQLRPMTINDAVEAARLAACAHAGAQHTTWSAQMFEDEVVQTGRSWWVAHDQGTLVGFAGGMLSGADFDVCEVVVDPDRRREGIATRLLARVAYDAQMLNATALVLEVDEKNHAAHALYESLGLRDAGRRRNYYGQGCDALVMRGDLPLTAEAARVDEPMADLACREWPHPHQQRSGEEEQALREAGDLVLTIETSCDETAMAITTSAGRVLASVVATQIDFHARFGGVVPEIASRKHTEALIGVFEETLAQAALTLGVAELRPSDLAAVGVTAGPGLVGALVVGVAFAKGLCAATGAALIACHHLEGHLMANLFETPDLKPPFVTTLVSGGNTMLVHVRAWGDYHILGATIDDAVGEAFDKVAKALGLGYPGGPVISRLAAEGNPRAIAFPRAMLHSGDYLFSLSGLKTSVITYIQNENRAGRAINLPDLAASFQAAVVDVQVAKAVRAVEETGVREFCLGGGVAANPALRAACRETLEARGVRVTVPPLAACGDNAAMIGICAVRSWRAGVADGLTLDADPNAALGTWSRPEAPVVPQWERA